MWLLIEFNNSCIILTTLWQLAISTIILYVLKPRSAMDEFWQTIGG